MGKIIFAFGLILFVCILFWNKSSVENGDVIIQPDIVKNPIYKELDKEKEPTDAMLYGDKKMKPKTSDVNYVNDRNHRLDNKTVDKNYNCTAELKNNILTIRFGLNGLFGGQGFDIKCNNSKFKIVPYYSTDAIIVGAETTHSYNVIKQSLILNKGKYALGDSIFGYIDFKLIENEKTRYNNGGINMIENQKITHIGKGYFRGKIEQD